MPASILAEDEPISIQDLEPQKWYRMCYLTPIVSSTPTAILRIDRSHISGVSVNEDIYIAYHEGDKSYYVGKLSQARHDKCCVPMLIHKED